jgi:hypothetical protein
MGELYEVPQRTSGKKEIIIKAVVVERTIHNGSAARCPENIATRFLQSRNTKSWDSDQAEGLVDFCLGMDYPYLQPRHLEKEFRGGQLHLYTSVFGSSLILRRVELPEVLEAVDKPLGPAAPLQSLPGDEEAEASFPEDEEAEMSLPEDEEARLAPLRMRRLEWTPSRMRRSRRAPPRTKRPAWTSPSTRGLRWTSPRTRKPGRPSPWTRRRRR